jgi:hypothetical protein
MLVYGMAWLKHAQSSIYASPGLLAVKGFLGQGMQLASGSSLGSSWCATMPQGIW